MAPKADVRAAVQQLADTLAKDSIGSIDHAVNAKAIALSSPLVTDKLIELLSTGHKLKDIVPLTGFGSSLLDFRLRFRFSTDNLIDLPTGDFIVSVELPTKSVKRILEPSAPLDPSTVAAPFSLAVPSQAAAIRTPVTQLTNRFNRAQAFFRRQGLIRPLGGYGDTAFWSESQTQYGSPVDTNYGTESYSDGIPDDTMNDTQYDVSLDFAYEYQLDYKTDTI
jgi:hypothetical protein